MAKKLDPKQYENAKAKLDKTGNNIKQVAGQTGLGQMTLRRIAKSKSYKSYEALSRNAHVTKEQRQLMREGHTLADARAMLTTAKPDPGKHDSEPDTALGDFEDIPLKDEKPKTSTVKVTNAPEEKPKSQAQRRRERENQEVAIFFIVVGLAFVGLIAIIFWLINLGN